MSEEYKNDDLPEIDLSAVNQTSVEVVHDDQEAGSSYPANADEESPVFVALNNPWDEKAEFLSLPSGRLTELKDLSERAPNINMADTEKGREWLNTLRNGTRLIPMADMFSNTVDRPNAVFKQRIQSQKGPLAAAAPSFKYNTGDTVSGEAAILRIKSLLGNGSLIQIPLWHSGFWITIKAPDDLALLDLLRRLMEEKINAGRRTYGMIFGNMSSFVTQWMVDMVMQHVYDTSIKDMGDKTLRDLILATDYTTIVWGLALAIWKNGFQYARPCTNDPETCNHVVKEKINLSKILWVDDTLLNEQQKTHMANRGGTSMSLESVMFYREQFAHGKEKQIELADNIKMTLRVPNLNEYIASGQRWINGIASMVEAGFTEEPDEDYRNRLINERANATTMRQFSHWVSEIDAGGNIITDTATIEGSIDALCASKEIRKKYFEEAKKYIGDSTIAIVAVPHGHCPNCKKELGKEDVKFKRLIAIDPVSAFFTLLVPKCSEIQTRMD